MPSDRTALRARMLRIGLASPYSMSIPGGVQAQVMGLARAYRAMGHEARVLAPCDGPPPAPFVMPMGDSIPTAANGSVAPLAPDPAAQLRTMRALRDEGFDVMHVHEPLSPGPGLTSVLMHLSPVVGTFHAAGDSSSYKYLNSPLRAIADRLDVRVAVSEDAEKLSKGYLGGDYLRLFNGVELERFRAAAPWPIDDRPTIFFCGRHEPRKGLAVLLEALRHLPDNVRCWVASDGPATAELKARFGNDGRIEWLGRLSDEEKFARLKAATVFCAPSLMGESFGVVLIEAMAAGTAIVATDLPGYLNVAHPDVHALMVPVGDEAALASALQHVFTDAGLRSRLVAAGSIRADEFSMDTLARRYIDIFVPLIDRWRTTEADAEREHQQAGWVKRLGSRIVGAASR